ncbi:MAG: exo-1,3-beta-glucanase [Cirrosporium novae-zelandiae]|nr:MAG: exo-1,3-beta-glucanase [Cirrosporium novae-zelandiae]
MRVNKFFSKTLVTLTSFSSLALSFPLTIRPRDGAFDYTSTKVRGVNLGGWLVLEPWITPSLFEQFPDGNVVDEWTFCEVLGSSAASSQLSAHWNSWITQSDFQEIAAAGLNHVRIPIGYWAVSLFDGDPYVQGQLAVLDSAVGWARAAGLKVMIDLHGAPGSQNGFDNSGHRGSIDWTSDDTVSETLTVLLALASRYSGDTDVVTAIELLNEPADWSLDMDTVKQFYRDAFGEIRTITGDYVVVAHDAFEGVSYWNGFESDWNNFMLDTHVYQIFDDTQIALSPDEHNAQACSFASSLATGDYWTIVGEFTSAQTDCAKWLNGYGIGARYDGTKDGSSYIGSCDGKYTGSVSSLSSDDQYNIRRFTEAQLDAYETKTGWIFWCWKTESAPEWNMQQLLAGGLFPQPLTDRQYPSICS